MLSGDNGLLKRAGDARDDTVVGQEKEQVELAYISAAINKLGNDVTDDELQIELDNSVGDRKTEVSKNDDNTLNVLFTDTEHNYNVDNSGNVNKTTPPISIADYVRVGDYVNYDPTHTDINKTQPVESSLLTYSSPTGSGTSHGNGYTSSDTNGAQTFTANSDIKWRVLSISNNKIELISEEVIKKDQIEQNNGNFVLTGTIGYLYAEQELNEICKIYGYGYGADTSTCSNFEVGGPLNTESVTITGSAGRSITIEDINKLAGITENDYSILNSSYGDMTNPTVKVFYPTTSTATGKSLTKYVQQLRYTYYSYNASKISDSVMQNIIFFQPYYWLASRCIKTDGSLIQYELRAVNNEIISYRNLCTGYTYRIDDTQASGHGIRPIVTLNSRAIDVSNVTQNNDNINVWSLK